MLKQCSIIKEYVSNHDNGPLRISSLEMILKPTKWRLSSASEGAYKCKWIQYII